MLSRWKKAVVHLECAANSEHFIDYIDRVEALLNKLDSKESSREALTQATGKKHRDLRFHGTAIFFQHNGLRYLLTARHVLWDRLSAQREWQAQHAQGRASGPDGQRIFEIIFRVPTLDEIVSGPGDRDRQFLMHLNRAPNTHTFSNAELDLAVIALDPRDKRFADELEAVGYRPIGMENIGDEPDVEGAEVFAVGYPSATAMIGQLGYHWEKVQWASNYFSLPTITFGRVAMLHELLSYFWVDMSIYPGNSGSPVVQSDTMVGMVHEQAAVRLELESPQKGMSRIPFGKIIKAKYIKELIRQHQASVGVL